MVNLVKQERAVEAELVSHVNDQDAMAIATTRAAQEVQAAMVIAKKFPRDTITAEKRILDACKRTALAEQAMYAYPRGGTTVEGPSIRLAEVLAQNWGNIDTGIIELDQAKGESTMMAYCWDLETNTRQTKIFTVKHERHTKQGVTRLVDPRDIYEMTANQGARRQRACILGVIPGDIVDRAVEECNATLKGNQTEPLADRAKKLLATFEGISVTKEMIEKRLGHRLDTLNETEYLTFRKIWKAISDNMQPVAAYFGADSAGREKATIDVSATLGKATETTSAPGGTAETALKPKAEEPPAAAPETLPADEAPNPEPASAPPTEPEPVDETAGIIQQIGKAWAAQIKARHGFDPEPDMIDEQIENYCVNHWAKMPFGDVVSKKPQWLPKLLGFITEGKIPVERYDFGLQPGQSGDAPPAEPRRPARRPTR